jgi:hypothetical protein
VEFFEGWRVVLFLIRFGKIEKLKKKFYKEKNLI